MKKVIVVDDEEDLELLFMLNFHKEILEQKIDVIYFSSAESALTFLKNSLTIKDTVILSDIRMPGMNGFDFLKEVKMSYQDIPVCMISAFGDEHHRNKAKLLGADAFFEKPLDIRSIKNNIEKYHH